MSALTLPDGALYGCVPATRWGTIWVLSNYQETLYRCAKTFQVRHFMGVLKLLGEVLKFMCN